MVKMSPRRRLPAVIMVTLWMLSGLANLAACNVCHAGHGGAGAANGVPAYHSCCGQSGQCCCNSQAGQTVEPQKAHSPLCICEGRQSERSEATLPAAERESGSKACHQTEALITPAPSWASLRAVQAHEAPPPPGFMVLVKTSITSRSPPTA
jgi:hypothetical protein